MCSHTPDSISKSFSQNPFADSWLRSGYLFVLLLLSTSSFAAAPDDITDKQRAWFDAVDLNANGDYTDNPANNSNVGVWSDKSGSNNHISSVGTDRPLYRHNSLLSQRHGLDFDGIDDHLKDSDDIWIGEVDTSETFIVATTDKVTNSVLFGSADVSRNRLSTHMPWGNGISYFDHGYCCSAPARMYSNLGIVLSQQFVWHFIGSPMLQAMVRDGETMLSDTGAGVYSSTTKSNFTLAAWPLNKVYAHDGRVFEGIFYQSNLNNAQRSIVSTYLSSKWDKALSGSATYLDVYEGNDVANGDYDFFVGGIGQDNGQQLIGTSQGLTITDNSFLTSDGKYVLAGVDYLLSAPTIGTSTLDVPVSYTNRSARTWYMDTTGKGGLVDLSFNAAQIGIPVVNGATYGLLYRPSTSGVFTEVATATMSSGTVTFSHLPADGVYAIGESLNEVALSIVKSVDDTSPNIGQNILFTLTVDNVGPAVATNASVLDVLPAGLGSPTVGSSPAGSSIVITGNTINWTGISVPVGGSASATFSAVVLPP